MCGVAGFISLGKELRSEGMLQNITRAMTDAISHRGPNDSGIWIDADLGIAVGHRRLSILDTSSRGKQPFSSSSNRYVISYNGEIYNFKEIRQALDAVAEIEWNSNSDTEVLIEAIQYWGLEGALTRCNGMFAFALWDRKERVLSLVRDRVGKKPMYYGVHNKTLLFGSELKALETHPQFDSNIDRNALAMLLKHNYIPSPWSIYTNVKKIPPAKIIQFSLDRLLSGDEEPIQGGLSGHEYWSLKDVLENGGKKPFTGDKKSALQALDSLLLDAVESRMISDVPLGAFLSGGIDSSAVVAAMQRISTRAIKTFSIGYRDIENDESRFARDVAKHLGTDHTDIYLEPDHVIDSVSSVGSIMDEPSGDTAMIPTYLLSKMTSSEVTVALSGDGGDEIFAGYPRYLHAEQSWGIAVKKYGYLPDWLRLVIASLLSNSLVGSLASRAGQNTQIGVTTPQRLFEASRMLKMLHPENIYEEIHHWDKPELALVSGNTYTHLLNNQSAWLDSSNIIQKLVYLDMGSRLPDSILAKVDRASMCASLETRAPLLDYRMVEFAATIPMSMKVVNGDGKWLLRELLYRHVPRELVDRPKKGFSLPIAEWLRGPLKDWAESLLDESRLRQQGYFNGTLIRQYWAEHCSGKNNWHYQLWNVLMFQCWLDSK